MTIPIPAWTEQELGVLEARRGADVGFELADAELEFGCGNGKPAGGSSVVLDIPPCEVP